MSVIRQCFALATVVGCVIAARPAAAAAIVWDSGPGANGHAYEAILADGPISWEEAQADAIVRGGYLATVLSADENSFVYSVADSEAYWVLEAPGSNALIGPWLGGFQEIGGAEPAGGWTWLNGEGAFVFTSWTSGEPSDGVGGPRGLPESRLHFFAYNTRASSWNDYPANFAGPVAYVVEYNALPTGTEVPEPATGLLVAAGVAGIARLVRRRRSV